MNILYKVSWERKDLCIAIFLSCNPLDYRRASQYKPDNFFSGLPIFTKVPPSLATPVQGTTFQVTCQAEGYPRPAVNWIRAVLPFPAGRTEVNKGTLTIKNLIPADNGLYECVATNIIGTKKARINVAVQRSSAAGLSYAARQGRIQDFSKVGLHHLGMA